MPAVRSRGDHHDSIRFETEGVPALAVTRTRVARPAFDRAKRWSCPPHGMGLMSRESAPEERSQPLLILLAAFVDVRRALAAGADSGRARQPPWNGSRI